MSATANAPRGPIPPPARGMNPSTPVRGRWIPWVFVGGMLLVVVVNGVMITAALSTFTGTTTGQAYDRGRSYGQVLEEAARQQALGWQAELVPEDGALLLTLRDRAGTPLGAGTAIAARLQRPLEREAMALDFTPTGPGQWRAPLALPASGQWEAQVTMTAGADRLELRRRLVLP